MFAMVLKKVWGWVSSYTDRHLAEYDEDWLNNQW